MPTDNPLWLVQPRAHAAGVRVRLLCFPYAGGDASVFAGWQEQLPPWVEVWSAQYPGHGRRLGEPPLDDLLDLTRLFQQSVPRDVPFALLGLSFGAMVAFELARFCSAAGNPPCTVFVGCRGAPQWPMLPPLHGLDDADMVRALGARYGDDPLRGMAADTAGATELIRLLRADIRASECHTCAVADPLPCPLVAFGSEQDVGVAKGGIAAWAPHTVGTFTQKDFAGGHFFFREDPTYLLRLVRRSLEAALPQR